jgi:hypothetical protein
MTLIIGQRNKDMNWVNLKSCLLSLQDTTLNLHPRIEIVLSIGLMSLSSPTKIRAYYANIVVVVNIKTVKFLPKLVSKPELVIRQRQQRHFRVCFRGFIILPLQ